MTVSLSESFEKTFITLLCVWWVCASMYNGSYVEVRRQVVEVNSLFYYVRPTQPTQVISLEAWTLHAEPFHQPYILCMYS